MNHLPKVAADAGSAKKIEQSNDDRQTKREFHTLKTVKATKLDIGKRNSTKNHLPRRKSSHVFLHTGDQSVGVIWRAPALSSEIQRRPSSTTCKG